MKNLPKFLIILLLVFLIVDAILLGIYLSKSKGFKLTLPSFLKKEPELADCLFVDEKVCLKAKKYEKLSKENIIAKAFRFKSPQKIKAPFDGYFVYSLVGTINFNGKHLGKTPTLIFYNKEGEKMKLFVAGAKQLKGQVATAEKVLKGEVVAEVFPDEIDFLDNYSLIKVVLPKL